MIDQVIDIAHLIFQEREDELSTLQQRLKALNRNAQQMMMQETLSNQDKENMSKDLDNLNSRWKKVIMLIYLIKACVKITIITFCNFSP